MLVDHLPGDRYPPVRAVVSFMTCTNRSRRAVPGGRIPGSRGARSPAPTHPELGSLRSWKSESTRYRGGITVTPYLPCARYLISAMPSGPVRILPSPGVRTT